MSDATPRTFELRHLQLARALFAAMASIMIVFSQDHSAAVGLSVFSGFAIATSLVYFLSAWLIFGSGERALPIVMGIVTLIAGMFASSPMLRNGTTFFVVVIAWAAVTGLIELISGIRGRRTDRPGHRDAILIGAVTLAFVVGLLVVNPAYRLDYFVPEASAEFSLTGIGIAVGIFSGYAAIVAVFLGIAGFSPRATPIDTVAPASPIAPVGENA